MIPTITCHGVVITVWSRVEVNAMVNSSGIGYYWLEWSDSANELTAHMSSLCAWYVYVLWRCIHLYCFETPRGISVTLMCVMNRRPSPRSKSLSEAEMFRFGRIGFSAWVEDILGCLMDDIGHSARMILEFVSEKYYLGKVKSRRNGIPFFRPYAISIRLKTWNHWSSRELL